MEISQSVITVNVIDANPSILQMSKCLFSTDGVKQGSQIDLFNRTVKHKELNAFYNIELNQHLKLICYIHAPHNTYRATSTREQFLTFLSGKSDVVKAWLKKQLKVSIITSIVD